MALNNFKRNHLMPLHFKGLMYAESTERLAATIVYRTLQDRNV